MHCMYLLGHFVNNTGVGSGALAHSAADGVWRWPIQGDSTGLHKIHLNRNFPAGTCWENGPGRE